MPSVFIVKRTADLSERDEEQIRALFFAVFKKQKTAPHFQSQFRETFLGYSYHALMVNEGVIVGCYSSVPYQYSFFGQKCLFALSVDTMILTEYRGMDNLLTLARSLYAEMKKDGIEFVFGFPNDNIYKIRKRFLKWRDLGNLDYFVLPLRFGPFFRAGRFLNFLSLGACRLLTWTGSHLPLSLLPDTHGIHVVDDTLFRRHRYALFDKKYRTVRIKEGVGFTYRIDFHEGIRSAYLIDCDVLSPRQLCTATNQILRLHHHEIDTVVYIGKLSFNPFCLFKIPKRFEPKKIYMSGQILAGKIVDERIYSFGHWRLNLANFDVV